MAAGKHEPTSKLLGTLRLQLARRENLLDPAKFAFLWVVDFPMFEWVEEEKRHEFMHHPFTSPLESDAALLETDPGRARARAYDLVLNGSEIAGGSIRIHDQTLQRLIFKLLQISDEEARAVRLLPRRARIRHAAARRHRARARPRGGDSLRRELDPRGHRVSQDGAGCRPHGRRAVDGQPEATAGAAPQAERLKRGRRAESDGGRAVLRSIRLCNVIVTKSRSYAIPPTTPRAKSRSPTMGSSRCSGATTKTSRSRDVVQRPYPYERARGDRRGRRGRCGAGRACPRAARRAPPRRLQARQGRRARRRRSWWRRTSWSSSRITSSAARRVHPANVR